MPKDALFKKKRRAAADFNFGKETATVFDDMLDRSVPFYAEVQRMIGELAADFALPKTTVYDLGCSTGNTLLTLDQVLPRSVQFVGVDSSAEMLKRARHKLRVHGARPARLVCGDLNKPVELRNASVVVLNLTLQFVRPLQRVRLIRDVAAGLRDHGCLLLIEKILSRHATLNRLFIKHYYAFKARQGYSELEISQKREALENVLIPYRIEENTDLLLANGFRQCELFFRWYNFSGLIALK